MRKTISTLVLSITFLLAGCGPPRQADEVTSPCQPYGTFVEAAEGSMKIGWKVNCDLLISGYNVYIAPTSVENFMDTSILPVEPYNTTIYPGDTDPADDIVFYDASGLENGVLYQVAARVVFPDRSLSSPSKPVLAMCGPRGEFVLATRYSGERDGFSFALGKHVRADDLNNDLYFYSKNGVHYLASPSRLDGFLRTSQFMHQSKLWNFEEYILLGHRHGEKPTDDRVEVHEGDLLWMTTDDAHQVQVRVLKTEVVNGTESIQLEYIYWPTSKVQAP